MLDMLRAKLSANYNFVKTNFLKLRTLFAYIKIQNGKLVFTKLVSR